MNINRNVEITFTYKQDESTKKKDKQFFGIILKHKDSIITRDVEIENIRIDEKIPFETGSVLYTMFHYKITCKDNKLHKDLKKL